MFHRKKNELLLRHVLSVINVPCVINIKCALRERKKVNSLQSKICEQETYSYSQSIYIFFNCIHTAEYIEE